MKSYLQVYVLLQSQREAVIDGVLQNPCPTFVFKIFEKCLGRNSILLKLHVYNLELY